MTFSMSGGAWNYNRFDQYEQDLQEKKADKDYDGDGKVESGKDEYFGSKDKAIKKAMGKDDKDDKKSKKDDCECKEEVEVLDEKEKKKGRCWTGYKPTPGKEPYSPGSCQKESVVKEDVIEYILENEMATNEVSAEVLFNVMSDDYLEDIEADIMEAYQTMSPKATAMSKRRSRDLSDQEYKAAGTGDSKKTNDLMHKKIKVMDARGRHGAK